MARDDKGDGCFVSAKSVPSSFEVEVVEAESILWALELALDQDMTHIWVDSDCKLLITKLQQHDRPREELGNIIGRILVVARSFACCYWSFHRRETNRGAHMMASIRPFSFIFSSLVSAFP